jgi:hypothetical protein
MAQLDDVKADVKKALESVKWNLPDTPEKFKAYQHIQEALLWLSAKEILKEQE